MCTVFVRQSYGPVRRGCNWKEVWHAKADSIFERVCNYESMGVFPGAVYESVQ